KLIATFGEKRRIPIPYNQIPKLLINAVLATEDQRYFQHPGVDFPGLIRAAIQLIITGRKEQGGSTITMQVARSFYLTRHKTFGRKLREILLALKIENTLPKEKILELYLNKIFFGNRAYGVGAAAEVYYGKTLNQLSIDQYAMIAGIPKAPSVLNPLANQDAAMKRRNHVLTRMFELHYLDEKTYKNAMNMPLGASYHDLQVQVKAPYVAELAREQVERMYGDDVYTDGYKVYTTVDSNLQNAAHQAVFKGLVEYDQRHGYRGPENNLGMPNIKHLGQWEDLLLDLPVVNGLEPAAVIDASPQSLAVLRSNGSLITIPWEGLTWARRSLPPDEETGDEVLGPLPQTTKDLVHVGDLIRLMQLPSGAWRLAQIPKAEASLIVLSPQTGGIVAMVGGFDYQHSNFNRVTSAERQPGSSFKPFIYSAALDQGYTLASTINDAPLIVENSERDTLWRPQNDTHRFYGPTRLHTALIHSRNLVSIRLLDQMGISNAIKQALKFGFSTRQLPHALSLALGTATVTPLQLAAAYSVFANSGYKLVPYLINRVQNSQQEMIYQAKPLMACNHCNDSLDAASSTTTETQNKNPLFPTYAPHTISAQNAFLITSVLSDVIQHGTGSKARNLRRSDLAGKTGTTNNQFDAWFAGYNRDLVAVAWVGFDQPQSLHEYGNQAALPIWMDFMQAALKNRPERPFEQPPGIVSVRISAASGKRASTNEGNAIFEYFMTPYLPETESAATLSSETAKKESNDIY
ncbi:MAG TPA: penicillin-binding protein 1A, partial [Gammaproteobacteria bacterium]|nr:penicillin-binding protein 1A [Gammaproteobacteria bacterium]